MVKPLVTDWMGILPRIAPLGHRASLYARIARSVPPQRCSRATAREYRWLMMIIPGAIF